jgi:hypothetical protein
MRSMLLLAAALAAPLPALAHHSIAAIYDRDKSTTVEGRLTKIELINPHSLLQLEVEARGGKMVTWTLESRGAFGMEQAGFTKAVVKEGDEVKAVGFPAENGDPSLWLQTLTTASGKSFSFVRRR